MPISCMANHQGEARIMGLEGHLQIYWLKFQLFLETSYFLSFAGSKWSIEFRRVLGYPKKFRDFVVKVTNHCGVATMRKELATSICCCVMNNMVFCHKTLW